MSQSDEPLDLATGAELRRRFGSAAPPRSLEDEVVEALQREGLVAAASPRSRAPLPRLAAAAAAILLFAAGYVLGGLSAASAPPEAGGRYLLLLREPSGAPITGAAGEAEFVREYSTWARERAQAGQLELGEKLAVTRAVVGGAALDGSTEITGLFIVRAPDLDTARAIAATCPHVRYGGTIEIRPIEPT